MNKFDKPYRVLPTYDMKKAIELFNLASKLDTHELLQFSLINQIPLDVVNDNEECLIHEVISIDMRIATQHSKLNVIKFLVQNGVNPDKPNKYNKTPLHLACSMQLELIVDYLLSLGVNPNFQDNTGYSSMHYHLTGHIKPLARDNEVIDFISTINPNKQNTMLADDIMEIKKLVWDLLDKRDASNNIPIFDTINKTLNNILTEDDDIVKNMNKLIDTIQILSTKSDGDILPAITMEINLAKATIKNKINDLFNKFASLNNFVSYDTNDNLSWAPSSMPTKTVIQNGNTRRLIKNDITKMIDNIEELNKFKENNVEIGYMKDGINDIYTEHFHPIIKDKLANLQGGKPNVDLCFDDNMDQIMTEINSVNNSIRHNNAIDNASSIIDFNNNQYMGGPRVINPIIPANILDELKSILALNTIDKQVLFLLGLNLDEIKLLPDNYIFDYVNLPNIFGTDVNITCLNTPNELQEKVFTDDWYYINGNQIKLTATIQSQLQLITEFKYYIIFTGIILLDPINFSRLNSFNKTVVNGQFDGNIFANKWYNIYMKNSDIRQFIFGMWCDLMCKMSNSNLECSIHTRTLMLIRSIDNKTSNMLQNVINIYKPQIINKITIDVPTKWIVTLLNDNIDMTFLNSITSTSSYDESTIDNLPINGKLKDLGKLIHIYINNPDTITSNSIYIKYAKTNKQPIDNLCKLILDYYNNNMIFKPMEQTMLDTIYILRNNNNFNAIMTPSVTSPIFGSNPFILSNIIPSHNSLYNYYLDQNVNDHPDINKYHYIISHYMGLHYIGLLYNIDFSLEDPIIMTIEQKQKGAPVQKKINIYTVVDNADNPSQYHTTTAKKIDDNMLPLPLNYICLDPSDNTQVLSDKDKENYYSLINEKYRMPSYQSYCMSIIKKIERYQTAIVNKLKVNKKIIDMIKKGETQRIKSIYNDIYPSLVTLCRIIEYYKNMMYNLRISNIDNTTKSLLEKYKKINTFDYNVLATMLNGINSNYYLYYYLFSPEKLIKLSKFNYYMLPIYKPSSYVFYDDMKSDNVNIMEEDNNFPTGKKETNISDNAISGIINNMSSYNMMLNDYYNNILPVSEALSEPEYFKRLKRSRLPPALYDSLGTFYNYSLIEIIKKIIEHIDSNKPNVIYKKTEELVKRTLISTSNNELAIYNILCKVIEELVQEQIKVYIDNAVIRYYNNFYVNLNISKMKESTLFTLKDMSVSLGMTKIKLNKIRKEQLQNLYQPIMKLPSEIADMFILYPNDLSNMNKLKIKYGLHVNKEIVKILLNNNASPFIFSFEGMTPIYPIIKNYNYILVEELINLGIDFRDYEKGTESKELPIEFIKTENNNNINKILNFDINLIDISLNRVLSNIDKNLYFDVKAKIISNEIFGNNVLLYLPESFNICSYLTLQYLSEQLLNTNTEFTIENASDLLQIFKIDIADMNKNYLVSNIKSLSVPKTINTLIAKELEKEKLIAYDMMVEECKKLNEMKNKLAIDLSKVVLSNKLDKSIQELESKRNILKDEVTRLQKLSRGPQLNINPVPTDDDMIDRYDKLNTFNNIDRGLIIWAWSKMIEQKVGLNPNLLPLHMLMKQKEYFKDFKNSEDIIKIKKGMKFLAKIGETYFETSKFTEMNPFLVFIEDLLNYMTKMVIGNGIEMIMRRILLTYFTSIDPTGSIKNANYRIEQIMDSTEAGKDQTLHDILYDRICPLLVKNSVEIFANRTEEQASYKMQVREILTNYFKLLENSGIALSSEVIRIFNRDVVTYFDTFTSRTISLWYVNIENILKYFINNYRCLETYNKLTRNSLS